MQTKDGELIYGHKAERMNVCNDCGGPLRDENGSYYSRLAHEEGKTFAAAICADCKDKRKNDWQD